MFVALLLTCSAFAQRAQETDTLTIALDDSLSQAYNMSFRKLAGVDADTNSTFTSAKFLIQTCIDTAGDYDDSYVGDWKTVQYEGTDITVAVTAGKINYLSPTNVNGFKTYIRFKCLDSSDATETEDAPRTIIPLTVTNF